MPELDRLLDEQTGSSLRTIQKIGLARRQPLLATAKSIISHAQQQQLTDRFTDEATELLSMWLFAIHTLRGFRDLELDLLSLLQSLVRRGAAFLASDLEGTNVTCTLGSMLKELIVSSSFRFLHLIS